MANSFIQFAADQTGKKIRMFENVISGNTVEAMAVSAVDPTGYSTSYVQVAPDSTGKKVQYFQNIIGGSTVLAQAVVLVDSTGTAI